MRPQLRPFSPASRTAPRSRRSRAGAVLVFALFAVAALVSIATIASVAARGRAARAASRIGRATLRDEAHEALAAALWSIEIDTNAVDSLSEEWAIASGAAAEALQSGRDGVFTVVSDECARLGLPECGENALAALFAAANPGLDGVAASGLARDAFLRLGACATNLPCEEALVALFQEDDPARRDAVAAALPFLSAVSGKRFNANTAPREVVLAAALGGGATRGGAEGLWLRLEMARGRGDVLESTDPQEALKLAIGAGDMPTAEEIAALAAIESLVLVDSGLFRVRSTARRGGRSATVECVYERATGRLYRWVER